MDQDGDLEALYETQGLPRVAGGRRRRRSTTCNWLDYYGARLYDGARRKELLEAAEKGFSQFAVGDQKGELITESLLGRGLCYLELGDTDVGGARLQAGRSTTPTSRRSARPRRAWRCSTPTRAPGRIQDTLRYSDELLRGGTLPAADVPLVQFYRLADALRRRSTRPRAPTRSATAARRRALMDTAAPRRQGLGGQGRRADGGAHRRSRRSGPARRESPRVQWELARLMLAKNDYDGATPLLQQLVASNDAEAKAFQPEAHYWLGVGALQGQRLRRRGRRVRRGARRRPRRLGAARRAICASRRSRALMAKQADAGAGRALRGGADRLRRRRTPTIR